MTVHPGLRIFMVAACLVVACISLADDSASADMQPLLDRLVLQNQGWGELGINVCAHAPNTQPLPLRIGDNEYTSGFGTHAPGELVFMLDGQFTKFSAELGVQPQNDGAGSVVFAIHVDGALKFTSDVLREKGAPVPVEIDVTGADELRIVLSDAGDGIACDVANVVNPRLEANPNAAKLDIERLDIAPFARVMTWGPYDEGSETKRTEPFIADDVYMGFLLERDPDGPYEIPVDEEAVGCIGLEWAERRLLREVALHVNDAAHLPPLEHISLQLWSGESPWQGAWHDVESELTVEGTRIGARLNVPKDAAARQGHEKLRWIIKDSPVELRVVSLEARSFSRMRNARLRVETQGIEEVPLTVYNGYLADRRLVEVNQTRTFEQDIVYSDSQLWKGDHTVLQFDVPGKPVAIAVDDVIEAGSVYIPAAGVMVSRTDVAGNMGLRDAELEQKQTLLDKVRAMPDQTFAQAMERVHNPIQDHGPMLVSLACDNRKFVAHRNGAITFEPYATPDDEVPFPDKYRYLLEVRRDGRMLEPEARHLRGDWLPAPQSTWRNGNVVYTQCVYVAPLGEATVDPQGWLNEKAACIVEVEARVDGNAPADAAIQAALLFGEVQKAPVEFVATGERGFAATLDGAVRAWVMPDATSAIAPALAGGTVTMQGALKPGDVARMRVVLPAWNSPEPVDVSDAVFETFAAYWERVLAPAAQIVVPDVFLTNLIRASQVHCLLAARNEDKGSRIGAWISADRYGPFESEAHAVIRGMDLLGNQEYARRSLDFFIHRYAPEGYLTTGYTIVGTGWHLWTLAEYVARSGNTEWLKEVAPDVARACQWIVDERAKTMDHGEFSMPDFHPSPMCPPECGLMPATVAADWNRYAYRFFQEAHYYAGLKQAGEALASIGYDGASTMVSEADALRESTVRAYRYTQGRAPAQALDTGAWIPAYPGMLYCFGRIEDIIPGEDWNRSWCYDVEIGAHQLAALGVLDPKSDEVGDMLEHMEEFWFLHQGMGDYPEDKNHQDWFNLGGFAKVQPYYARNAEVYALRDDVKPFVRSYFNTIPTLVSRENLSFWEHFHNTGGWNKTHETGYFLAQTRFMLIQERGNELWIAPLITDRWLMDGNRIEVRNAPTAFGAVSYTIDVHADSIAATIEPDLRTAPEAIVVRLRHPEGRAVVGVSATGCGEAVPNAADQSLKLTPPFAETIKLSVNY